MRKMTFLLLICAALSAGCRKDAPAHPDNNQNTETGTPGPEVKPSERPTDFEIGSRAIASWKVPETTYLKALDLEVLREHPEKIDQEQLKDLLQFKSSSVDGSIRYDFTAEDMKDVRLEDLSYDFWKGILSFNISYRNIGSKAPSKLDFPAADYYSLRLPVNKEYVSSHYMRGIYEYIGAFTGNVLKIEDERYMPGEIISKGKDDHRNAMTFTFKVYDRIRNEEVIEITKDLSGFRTLADLASSMKIIPTHELLEAVKSAVTSAGKYPEKSLLQVLRPKFSSQKWMEMMQYELDGKTLAHTGTAITGSGNRLDVYLERLRWYLKSADLTGDTLTMVILLESSNDVVLTDISYRIELKGLNLNL